MIKTAPQGLFLPSAVSFPVGANSLSLKFSKPSLSDSRVDQTGVTCSVPLVGPFSHVLPGCRTILQRVEASTGTA